jgi:hypothetical protein
MSRDTRPSVLRRCGALFRRGVYRVLGLKQEAPVVAPVPHAAEDFDRRDNIRDYHRVV